MSARRESLAEHSHRNWTLPFPLQNWAQVRVALLMDIREELEQINRFLRCQDFLQIPHTLAKIERNMVKKPRPKPKPKRKAT